MSDTKITVENFADYPAGTKVEFHFGAYYPTVEGVVTGYDIIPATKWFPASIRLIAEYPDIETDEPIVTSITSFSDKGIGVRLIERNEVKHVRKNSPWKK